MNTNTQTTEELNNIPIQTVASLLGINLPKTGSAKCPFHDDKNPSFEIKKSGTYWQCYGCGRKGGSIDFVKEHQNISFLDAKNWLNGRMSGASLPIKKRSNPAKITELEKTIEAAPDIEVYEHFLTLCPLLETGKKYLASRAITKTTIENFRVGQLSNPTAVLADLLKKFRFERIKKAGLLTKKSTIEKPRLIFSKDSLIFPFIKNDQVIYIQSRILRKEYDNQAKWLGLNGIKKPLYNADAATATDEYEYFAICEGVMDTISAIELGYGAIGILGATTALGDDQIKSLQGKEVDILLDWDEAGEKASQNLQRISNQHGIISIRKSRPSPAANDLNEYLVEEARRTS